MIRLAVSLIALIAALVVASPEVLAEDSAACSLYEIKASNDEGGIDKALKPLEKLLKKPPFSTWKSFKLLKKHDGELVRMKARTFKLASGGKVTLLFRDVIAAGKNKKKSKPRLRLTLTLDGKDGKRKAEVTIKIDSGDFNVTGNSEGKEMLILATTCTLK